MRSEKPTKKKKKKKKKRSDIIPNIHPEAY